jgi:hypothetical protein
VIDDCVVVWVEASPNDIEVQALLQHYMVHLFVERRRSAIEKRA